MDQRHAIAGLANLVSSLFVTLAEKNVLSHAETIQIVEKTLERAKIETPDDYAQVRDLYDTMFPGILK